MQDYLERLEHELTSIAAAGASASSDTARTPVRSGRRHRRPLLTGGLAATLAGVAVVAMTGTSTASLPILNTPTTDATAIRERAPGARAAGVDFSAAHRFPTPGGPAYVMVSASTDTICLVIPDPGAPGDFGASCKQGLASVEHHGLAAEFPGDQDVDPEATTFTVFLLPDGAKDPRLTIGGSSSKPTVTSGVAIMQLPTEATLHWTVDGTPSERHFEGPFPAAGTVSVTCPDGTHKPLRGLAAQASRPEVRQARKDACSR